MAIPTFTNQEIKQSSSLNLKSIHPDTKVEYFFTTYNRFCDEIGKPEHRVNLRSLNKKSFYEELGSIYENHNKVRNEKAISGAGATSGISLISTQFPELEYVLQLKGGIFIKAGARYYPEANGNYTFSGGANFGRFAQSTGEATTLRTAFTNDIAVGKMTQAQVILNDYNAEIPIFESVASRYAENPAKLYAIFTSLLENQKLVLTDDLAITAITTSSGVTALPVEAGFGSLTGAIVKAIGITSKYQFVPKIFLNTTGFATLQNERNSFGDPIQKQYAQFSFNTIQGALSPNGGLVGYFGSYEVHVVPAINNTFDVDASTNAITSATTGNKSLVMVGVPTDIGIIRGRSEFDTTSIFTSQNSFTAYINNLAVLGAKTKAGAGVINPASWAYYAF